MKKKLNTYEEVSVFLMKKSGFCEKKPRGLVFSVCKGYYGTPSSVLIEVVGSPVRGRCLVFGCRISHGNLNQRYEVSIWEENNIVRTYRNKKAVNNQNKASSIFNKIVSIALTEADSVRPNSLQPKPLTASQS